jgi:hypothetical protein
MINLSISPSFEGFSLCPVRRVFRIKWTFSVLLISLEIYLFIHWEFFFGGQFDCTEAFLDALRACS